MTPDPGARLAAARIELFSTFLERACALMTTVTSYQETLERVGGLVVPLFADWCAVDLLERDGWRRRLLQQNDPERRGLQERVFRELVPDGGSPHPISPSVASGKAELVSETTDAWIVERTPDQARADLLRETGVQSALFLPLDASGRLVGVLSMYATDPVRPPYDEDDLRFGELLATVVTAALRNVDYLSSAAVELAERRRVEADLRASLAREAARLAELQAIMDAVPAAVWIANDSLCTDVAANAAARRLVRMPDGSSPPGHLASPWHREGPVPEAELPLQRAAREGYVTRDEELELAFDDGTRLVATVSCVPLFDEAGRPRGAVGAALDITRLKNTEAELRRHRENLERMVRERTQALEETHGRLRESERMAMIGTLSAGLGHDMGNLLMPLRLRLDALKAMALPEAARADVAGIETAVQYLHRLSSGLRLLARGTEAGGREQEGVALARWWTEVEALLQEALPPGVILEADFNAELPVVALQTAELTQIVLNLIQNAGHALKGRPDARILVTGSGSHETGLALRVRDNGPGMSEETRRRCFEPFFSTKERQLSTGLGLAVVRGLVERAGGTITVESSPDRGATFTVILPTATPRYRPPSRTRRAWVTVPDPRGRALASSVLTSAGYDVTVGHPHPTDEGSVWLADRSRIDDPGELSRFVEAGPGRLAIVLGGSEPLLDHPRIRTLASIAKVDVLRTMLAAQATDGPSSATVAR